MTVHKFLISIESTIKDSNMITITIKEKFNRVKTKLIEFKYYNVIKTSESAKVLYDKELAKEYKKYKKRSIHKMMLLDNGDIEIVIPYWRN